MPQANLTLQEDYWKNFSLAPEDIDFLTGHLLEVETPLSPMELLAELIPDRLSRESESQRQEQASDADIYFPKSKYKKGQKLVFPALNWQTGEVTAVRPAEILNVNGFDVLQVELEDGSQREFAGGLSEHGLNAPPEVDESDPLLSPPAILETFGDTLSEQLERDLHDNDDFVYIAGRWFPRALIVEVGEGQLNVAEALLDVAEGGPLSTDELLAELELPDDTNPKLASFSLDLALLEDERFDEVGPAGEVAWFLHRHEPEAVRETPVYLRYTPIEHARDILTDDMLDLERRLHDELSPLATDNGGQVNEVQARLIFPHWRAGTLPLTQEFAQLFPTAYEAPRVRFTFVDDEGGDTFPGWVVRLERYVYGLKDWYQQHGVMPGSYVRVRRGETPGEIIVSTESHRSSKEWVRTALVGADGGVIFAMLKQTVAVSFDERMMIYMPSEFAALEARWQKDPAKRKSFEKLVEEALLELAKLNTQNHVHASELYAAVNLVWRVPPAPLLALLESRPQFQHVGDLHYRLPDSLMEAEEE